MMQRARLGGLAIVVLAGCSYKAQSIAIDLGSGSAVAVMPSQATANGIDQVTVSTSLQRPSGAAATGLSVVFTSDNANDVLVFNGQALAAGQSVAVDANGQAQVTFTSTQAGTKTIAVTAVAGNATALLGSAQVVFTTPTAYPSFSLNPNVASITAGIFFSIKISALQPVSAGAVAAVATDYVGTVLLNANDKRAVLPTQIAFAPSDQGVKTIAVQLITAGTAQIEAQDQTLGQQARGSTQVQVAPGPAAAFTASSPTGPITVGSPAQSLYINAVDAYGNAVNLSTSATISATGGTAEPDLQIINGTGTLQVQFTSTQGTLTVTSSSPAISSLIDNLPLVAGPPAKFVLTLNSASVPADSNVTARVALEDSYGNLVLNSNVSLQITSSDAQTPPLAPYPLQPADQGVHSFAVLLPSVSANSGGTTITVSDTAGKVPSQSAVVSVYALGPYFVGSWDTANLAVAGMPQTLTIRVLTPAGAAPVPPYLGTVNLKSSDPGRQAYTPNNASFASSINSTVTVSGIVFVTEGNQSIALTATNGSTTMMGFSDVLHVEAANPNSYTVVLANPAIAGQSATLNLAVVDKYGNPVTGYSNGATLKITPPTATSGQTQQVATSNNVLFQGGRVTFTTVVNTTSGIYSVALSDSTGGLSNTATFAVSPGPAYELSPFPPGFPDPQNPDPGHITAGVALSVPATILDSSKNVVTNFVGTVSVTSNNGNYLVSGATKKDGSYTYNFSGTENGTHVFVMTFLQAQTSTKLTLSAVAQGPSINATTVVLSVDPGDAGSLKLTTPLTVTAGVQFLAGLAVYDNWQNEIPPNYPSYNVKFTASGKSNLSSAEPTIEPSYSVALSTAGNQTLTVTITNENTAATLTQTNTIQVIPGPPTSLGFASTTPPFSAACQTSAAPIAVQVQDSSGNSVAQAGNVVTLSSGGPAYLVGGSGLVQTTDGSGRANFSNYALNKIGSITLTAQSPGLTPATQTVPLTQYAVPSLGALTASTVAQSACADVAATIAYPCQVTAMLNFGPSSIMAASLAPGGLGGGAFTPPTGPATFVWDSSRDLALGNVTRQLSLVVSPASAAAGTAQATASTSVVINNGVQFKGVTITGTTLAIQQAQSTDLNHDGKADVVFIDTQNIYTLLSGTANTVSHALPTGHTPTAVAVGDVTRDGSSDVMALASDGTVWLFAGSKSGALSGAQQVSNLTGLYNNLLLADINHDGSLDVVLTTATGTVAAATNNNNGGAGPYFNASQSTTVSPATQIGAGAQVADLDQDYNPDLVLRPLAPTNNTVIWVRGTGNGFNGTAVTATLPEGSAQVLAVAPLTSPPFLDIVVATNANTYLITGAQSGTLGTPQVIAQLGATSIVLTDINHDGSTDALLGSTNLTAGTASTPTTVCLGNAQFGAPRPSTCSSVASLTTTPLLAADVNGDGRADIFGNNNGASLYDNITNYPCTWGLVQPTLTSVATAGSSMVASVAVGDLNEDGKMDLVTTQAQNAAGNAVSVAFGDGQGFFAHTVTRATEGTGLLTTHLVDINADGHLDIAVFAAADQNLYIHYGRGNQAIANPNVIVGPTFAAQVLIQDVNNDGYVDIVWVGNGQLRVDTGPAYVPGTQTAVPGLTGTFFAILANLTRDNYPELVSCAAGSTTFSILAGSPTGPTAASTSFNLLTTSACAGLASGDINRDGAVDLMISDNGGPDNPNLLYYGNNGFANFTLRQATNPPAACAPGPVVVASLTGDNYLDAAVACTGLGTVFFLKGVGDGFQGTGTNLTSLANPTLLSSADFDGDGVADLLAGNGTSGSVSVGTLVSNGTMALAGDMAGGASFYNGTDLVLSDVNRDGLPDFVSSHNRNTLAVCIQKPLGGWSPPMDEAPSFGLLVATNLRDNGLQDLVGFGSGSTTWQLESLFSAGNGTFTQAQGANPPQTNAPPEQLAVGTLFAPGTATAVVALQNSPTLLVNANAQGQITSSSTPLGNTSATGVGLGDFDQDGYTDVALAASGQLVIYYYNAASNQFSPVATNLPASLSALSTETLAVGDLNNDGALDVALLAVNTTSTIVQVMLGSASRVAWTPSTALNFSTVVGATSRVVLADMNRDGWLDAVLPMTQTGGLAVALNSPTTGATPFSQNILFSYATGTEALMADVGDVNVDGKPDVVVLNAATGAVYAVIGR